MTLLAYPVTENELMIRTKESEVKGSIRYLGKDPLRIQLKPDAQLRRVGISVAVGEDEWEFDGVGEHHYSLVVPNNQELVEQGSLEGSIMVVNAAEPGKPELARISFTLKKILRVIDVETNDKLVLDLGGDVTTIGVVDDQGFHQFKRSPKPSALFYDIARQSFVEFDQVDPNNQASSVCIDGMKSSIDEIEVGPRATHPHLWPEIITRYLRLTLENALDESRGRPSSLVATIPASWTFGQRENYEALLRAALSQVGMHDLPIQFVDEATSGGIGTIQESVAKYGGSATRMAILQELHRPAYYLTIDIGSQTTDVSLAILTVDKVENDKTDGYPRFEAKTELRGVAGLPYAGWAFTRLMMLTIVARMAIEHPAFGDHDQRLQKAIRDLAQGDIDDLVQGNHPNAVTDPILSGANEFSNRVLETLAQLVLPHEEEYLEESRAARQYLSVIAEQIKIQLNTPDAAGNFPDSIHGDADEEIRQYWNVLAPFYQQTPKQGSSHDPAQDALAARILRFDYALQEKLFRPALQRILEVVAGMGRVVQSDCSERRQSNSKGEHPEPRVSFICLTGRGSRLREFCQLQNSPLQQALPLEHFDTHASSRILQAFDPKGVVANGAVIFCESQDEDTWCWKSKDLSTFLPYDIGTLTCEKQFEPLVKRGTALPVTIAVPPGMNRYELVRRDYDGAPPIPLGTLSFAEHVHTVYGDATAAKIRVDENRRITGQTNGTPTLIIPPVRRVNYLEAPALNSYEDLVNPRKIW